MPVRSVFAIYLSKSRPQASGQRLGNGDKVTVVAGCVVCRKVQSEVRFSNPDTPTPPRCMCMRHGAHSSEDSTKVSGGQTAGVSQCPTARDQQSIGRQDIHDPAVLAVAISRLGTLWSSRLESIHSIELQRLMKLVYRPSALISTRAFFCHIPRLLYASTTAPGDAKSFGSSAEPRLGLSVPHIACFPPTWHPALSIANSFGPLHLSPSATAGTRARGTERQ